MGGKPRRLAPRQLLEHLEELGESIEEWAGTAVPQSPTKGSTKSGSSVLKELLEELPKLLPKLSVEAPDTPADPKDEKDGGDKSGEKDDGKSGKEEKETTTIKPSESPTKTEKEKPPKETKTTTTSEATSAVPTSSTSPPGNESSPTVSAKKKGAVKKSTITTRTSTTSPTPSPTPSPLATPSIDISVISLNQDIPSEADDKIPPVEAQPSAPIDTGYVPSEGEGAALVETWSEPAAETPSPTPSFIVDMTWSTTAGFTHTVNPSDTSLIVNTITPSSKAAATFSVTGSSSVPSVAKNTGGATESSNSGLTKAQIGGIVGGLVGTLILTIITILLLRRQRRSSNTDVDSEKNDLVEASDGSKDVQEPQAVSEFPPGFKAVGAVPLGAGIEYTPPVAAPAAPPPDRASRRMSKRFSAQAQKWKDLYNRRLSVHSPKTPAENHAGIGSGAGTLRTGIVHPYAYPYGTQIDQETAPEGNDMRIMDQSLIDEVTPRGRSWTPEPQEAVPEAMPVAILQTAPASEPGHGQAGRRPESTYAKGPNRPESGYDILLKWWDANPSGKNSAGSAPELSTPPPVPTSGAEVGPGVRASACSSTRIGVAL